MYRQGRHAGPGARLAALAVARGLCRGGATCVPNSRGGRALRPRGRPRTIARDTSPPAKAARPLGWQHEGGGGLLAPRAPPRHTKERAPPRAPHLACRRARAPRRAPRRCRAPHTAASGPPSPRPRPSAQRRRRAARVLRQAQQMPRCANVSSEVADFPATGQRLWGQPPGCLVAQCAGRSPPAANSAAHPRTKP